jgi:hypothetical protein
MRKLFTGLLLLAAAFSFAQEDPHAQLTDALAKRRLGVTIQIPDGYVFTRPLVIPPGTRGFSLAIKGRLVKASDNFAAIEVGDTRHHWQFPFQALPVALEGQATLPLPDGWWFIYDDAQVVHATVPSSRVSYRCELVKVTSGALDQPLGRTYDLSVKAARVDVCERVSVSGLQTTGMALQIAYGVDCRVRDSGVSSFGGFAFRSVRSRRTVFENVRVQGATALGPGAGYGINVMWDRGTVIQGSYADTSRHGFIFHSGSMDCTVEDSEGNSLVGADFDTHGMDERRITFRRVRGQSAIGIGNAAWHLGGTGHLIEDCDVTGLYFGPGVEATVRRTKVRARDFYAIKLERPQEVRFEYLTYTGPGRTIHTAHYTHSGRATFYRCSFTSTDEPHTSSLGLSGEWRFLDSEFKVLSGKPSLLFADVLNPQKPEPFKDFRLLLVGTPATIRPVPGWTAEVR